MSGVFRASMQNVRPVLPGAEKVFDVEKLDICGPLTTELSSHFASHPLLLFNREGDCLAAKLRPGNVGRLAEPRDSSGGTRT
jgi:hypothetical protein